MSILNLSNVSKSFGENTLFSDVTFAVSENDRIGLIGSNGCGKTTLFKIINGELSPDSGGFSRKSGLSIGYLEQHACENSDLSAYCETLKIFSRLTEIETELNEVEQRLLTDTTPELLSRQASLHEEYLAKGGLTYKSRTRSTLLGLGLEEEKLDLAVSALSGGQRAKIGLAKLLLSDPELILLDEPTNHLDINAMQWLEEYLLSVNAAVIVISHDRYFLDKLCNRTFEITAQKLYVTEGNYTKHREVSELRKLTAKREYENTLKEIERIDGIIAQQKTFSMERNYRTIEHKQKAIDRLRAGLQKPDDEEKSVRFTFEVAEESGNDVLKGENLCHSFDGSRYLFKDIDIDLKKQNRLFLLGANGCGKTTLLKKIKDGGGITFGTGVKIGYFDQLQADLHPEKTIFDEVRDAFPALSNTEIRNALASFLFRNDDVFSLIADLSGGERARVSLVKLALGKKNLLLLDEPTNHLDLKSREVLEDALANFDGTLIAVSHDRYFINKLCTGVLYFNNGTATAFKGSYEDFLQVKPQEDTPEKKPKKQLSAGGAKYKEKKELRTALVRLKTRAKRLEENITANDTRTDEINALLSDPTITSDYQKVAELSEELRVLAESSEQLMTEWDEVLTEIAEKEDLL